MPRWDRAAQPPDGSLTAYSQSEALTPVGLLTYW